MSNKKSKKLRKLYRGAANDLANKDLKHYIFTVCRQRDWMFLIAIGEFIAIICLFIWR